MGRITFIIGGARSGKSTYAEKLANDFGKKVLYIATAIPFDEGMKARIKHHQESRPASWLTVEKDRDFHQLKHSEAFIKSEVVLLDCITVMVTNLMLDMCDDYDGIKQEELTEIELKIQKEVDTLLDVGKKLNKELIIVSNEVGLGVVPAYKLGNYFRDIAGRINQRLAEKSNQAFFVVSGMPLKIK